MPFRRYHRLPLFCSRWCRRIPTRRSRLPRQRDGSTSSSMADSASTMLAAMAARISRRRSGWQPPSARFTSAYSAASICSPTRRDQRRGQTPARPAARSVAAGDGRRNCCRIHDQSAVACGRHHRGVKAQARLSHRLHRQWQAPAAKRSRSIAVSISITRQAPTTPSKPKRKGEYISPRRWRSLFRTKDRRALLALSQQSARVLNAKAELMRNTRLRSTCWAMIRRLMIAGRDREDRRRARRKHDHHLHVRQRRPARPKRRTPATYNGPSAGKDFSTKAVSHSADRALDGADLGGKEQTTDVSSHRLAPTFLSLAGGSAKDSVDGINPLIC